MAERRVEQENAPSEEAVKTEVHQLLPSLDPEAATLGAVYERVSSSFGAPLSSPHKRAAKAAVDEFFDRQRSEQPTAQPSTGSKPQHLSMPERVENLLAGLDENESLDASQVCAKLNTSRKQANSALYKLKSAGKATLSSDKKPRWSLVQSGASTSGKGESNEETTITDLGGNKRLAVKSYQNNLFVDLRKIINDKPTKQGIMLTSEQYNAIRQASDSIDAAFDQLEQQKAS
jgi:hypothetical protein